MILVPVLVCFFLINAIFRRELEISIFFSRSNETRGPDSVNLLSTNSGGIL